jgi:competence protein ComEC
MVQWMVFLVLIATNALLFSIPTAHGLSVTFFDVGQGDSILIESPTGVQVLVDAGPDGSALRELGMRLPFWDRTLDAVVLTHPDQDHIGGMKDVLERYEVETIIEPGIANDTRAWHATLDAMQAEIDAGAVHTLARRGQRLELGGGVYADVLYPDKDVTNIKDTNSGSVVLRVVYGDTSFMLTGDLPTKEEQELFLSYGYGLDADVLKAGHHGSRTSSSADFVQSVSPEYVVFSRGCDNKYGHPHQEVVDFFTQLKIRTFDTCEEGTITFSSDSEVLSSLP